jgi:hypothetical protein
MALPPGRYVLDAVDDLPELTDDQEAGVEAATESVEEGKGVSADAAKARIDRILGTRRIAFAPEAADDTAPFEDPWGCLRSAAAGRRLQGNEATTAGDRKREATPSSSANAGDNSAGTFGRAGRW